MSHVTERAIAFARAAMLAGATLAFASAVSAAPLCEAPKTRIDRVACDKASESPTALRRYIARMQIIQPLDFASYMTPDEIERHYARERARPQVVAGGDDRR